MQDSEGGHDHDLIRRFRDGDRDAFTALYRVHSPRVFRFALLMTGDREKAGEVVQDVFVWLIHNAGGFDPARGSLDAFLFGVARKFVLRKLRHERRWAPLDETAALSSGLSSSPDAFSQEDTVALKRAIASLPVRYREAVVLCDLEEKTYEEAASVLGCATGTVRSRLHRARDLLARKLRPEKDFQRCRV